MFFSRARQDIATMNALLPEAERIAHAQGESEPAAEHLLIAALDLPDGGARRALTAAGADPDALADAVVAVHTDALADVGIVVDTTALDAAMPSTAAPRGPLRSTASAQDVFHRATDLAKSQKVPLASTHVLLAAARLEQGVVPRAFARLGVTSADVESAATAELG